MLLKNQMEKVKITDIINDFKKDYSHLIKAGAEIKGVFGGQDEVETGSELNIAISYGLEDSDLVNPFKCHISLWVSFFTDHRKIPKFYKEKC